MKHAIITITTIASFGLFTAALAAEQALDPAVLQAIDGYQKKLQETPDDGRPDPRAKELESQKKMANSLAAMLTKIKEGYGAEYLIAPGRIALSEYDGTFSAMVPEDILDEAAQVLNTNKKLRTDLSVTVTMLRAAVAGEDAASMKQAIQRAGQQISQMRNTNASSRAAASTDEEVKWVTVEPGQMVQGNILVKDVADNGVRMVLK